MNPSGRRMALWCCCYVFVAIQANAQPEVFPAAAITDVNKFLSNHPDDSNFGIVIGLLDAEGSKVFSAGKLDNGTQQEVDRNTLFEIGSITKTFTSLLLLEMAERSEVNLDDPVARYLPPDVQVPAYGNKEISLLHLACQDSGLPFNADNHVGTTWWKGFNAYTDEDLHAFLSQHKLSSKPGRGFQYSNIGMTLLGHALSYHSGKDFESLVTNRICKPLRLKDTRITLSVDQRRRLAVGHGEDGSQAPYYTFQVMQPAGSLYSTADDMLKFVSAQLGMSDSELVPLMKRSHVLRHEDTSDWGDTAMPWFNRGVYEPEGSSFLGHGGGTIGFSTFIGIDTQRKRGVVVLTSQRTTQGDRRVLVPAAVGWAVLQGLPLTEWTSTRLVYEVVGLGMEFVSDKESDSLRIARVFRDSPAEKAGLTPGLIVREINGKDTRGRSLQDCLGIMNSSSDSPVRLEVRRPSGGRTRSVELIKGRFLTIG